MNYDDPHIAQTIVAAYVRLLEEHGTSGSYPASVRTLPYPKLTIKGAIVTCHTTLRQLGQLTGDLNEFLESAYVALAEYVDEELAQALIEYREATAALEAQPAAVGERVKTPAWQRVAECSRLAGDIAKSIAEDSRVLREEFRHLAQAHS